MPRPIQSVFRACCSAWGSVTNGGFPCLTATSVASLLPHELGGRSCTMASMNSGVSKEPGRALFPALALTAIVMLVAASSALGQAAVDQYIPSASPTGNHGGGGGAGGGSSGSGSGGASSGGPTAAAGGAAKGSLGSGGAGLTNFPGNGSGSGS